MPAGDAVIGALRVTLGADTAKLEDGLKKTESALGSFAKRMTEIAAGIKLEKLFDQALSAINKQIFGTIDAIDAMGKAAQKFGVPVEQLSLLSRAAILSDVSVEQLGASLGKLSKNMVAVAGGATDQAAAAFRALGISVRDAQGQLKSSESVLLEISSRFATFEDGATKTALAIALFGRAGAEMIPFLNQGAAAIKSMTDRFREMGLEISQETFQAAEKFNDNLKEVGFAVDAVTIRILGSGGLLNAMERISDALRNTANEGAKFAAVGDRIGEALKVMVFGFQALFAVLGAGILPMRIIIESLAKLVMGDFAGAWKAITDRVTEFKTGLEGLKESFDDLFGETDPLLKEINQTLARSLALLAQFKMAPPIFNPNDIKDANAELEKFLLNFDDKLANRSDELTAKFATPWEKLQQEIAETLTPFNQVILGQERFAQISERLAAKVGEVWGAQIAGAMGGFADLAQVLSKENKKMFLAFKAFAIAEATINAYVAASKAWAQGGIFGAIGAAGALAGGLAQVLKISSMQPPSMALGGRFTVPGGFSMRDNKLIPMMLASGEQVEVTRPERNPRPTQFNITIRGDSISRNAMRELFDQINSGLRDGYRLALVE